MEDKNFEKLVIKQITDLTSFINEIDEMIKKDMQLLLVKKLLSIKVKQIIWFPDNMWAWYRWN